VSDRDEYLKHGIRRVGGYLHKGAASLIVQTAAIQSQLKICGHVAEIGVHEGRLFILLCLLREENEAAVAVDVFERQELNRDNSGRGSREHLQNNLGKYVHGGSPPILLSADSRTISASTLIDAAGGQFRLFSIDGGHDADTVFHDLEVAAGALCRGGAIVLDDFFNEGWAGVADGTCRFFTSHKYPDLVPFAIAQNKVLICDRSFADKYRSALSAAFRDKTKIRESTLFGHPVTYFDFGHSRLSLVIVRPFFEWAKQHPAALGFLRRIRDAF
jgi:Methyltransferase domain